ncbi:glycosyltransferase [Xylophilus sp. Kf1]|nr:glycosyltransferase [Xylophilus sp. Kf1]
MRVALVHEWLVTVAGSEKVVVEMLKIWPHADLYAVVDFLSDSDRARIGGKFAKTTFIQKLPLAKKKYQAYLPLMPVAIEQLDLSGYDLVVSSSHAVAKGVIVGPDQTHISYVHSPIRYAWDFQHQYLRDAGISHGFKSLLARWILHYMRIWDHRTAAGVDYFVANSAFIGRRIQKTYRRDSVVIPPPVDTEQFHIVDVKEDFYFTASRMVPYKKIPMIIEAFASMPDKKLIVIGDGPDFAKAKKAALNAPNVTLLGYQSFDVLRSHMQRAKAFVFAAEEDFGIAPVEAQACGTPVIAYGRGGALESVCGVENKNPSGLFYYDQTATALAAAVIEFEKLSGIFTATNCRANAEYFSAENFRRRFSSYVAECLEKSQVMDRRRD